MKRRILAYLRRALRRNQNVRVWALSAPVVVLLICLPLLRPLRHPDPRGISNQELSRLATIQSLGETGAFAIDASSFRPVSDTVVIGGKLYSDQPPTFAYLLSFPYRLMHAMGITLEDNPSLASYLLTLLGVTLPVAAGAGMIYKMGRLFELPRSVRAGMALLVVLSSGLVSYAVVLNAHAPAAALLLCACACFVHVLSIDDALRNGAWLIAAGLCAATAAVIDPPAGLFTMLLLPVIATMRMKLSMRIGGMILYLIGCAPALLLHAELNTRITGDVLPAYFNAAQAIPDVRAPAIEPGADEWREPPTWADHAWSGAARLFTALFGGHGVFSPFPLLIIALIGIAMLMHRHWPTSTKALASVTLLGACAVIVHFAMRRTDWSQAMFAARWFIVFLPLLMFWTGVWIRRSHHPATWVIAGVLAGYSVIISLIGATGPFPRDGYSGFSAGSALMRLVRPYPIEPPPLDALAGIRRMP